MHLLGIVAIIYVIYRLIREAFEPTIPAKNWENKELMELDRKRGMSQEEIHKNLKRGRYVYSIKYAEPHRDPKNNKIIIENYQLYKEECRTIGAYEAHKCVEQGKYNLTPSEHKIVDLILEKDNINLFGHTTGFTADRKTRLAEIDKILAASKWDYHKTEAVQYWEKAKRANLG